MMKLKNILGITVVPMATVTLQAQTYNDSVRVRTWSVYMQGGISSYHGVRSELFDNSKRTMAPDLKFRREVQYSTLGEIRCKCGIYHVEI